MVENNFCRDVKNVHDYGKFLEIERYFLFDSMEYCIFPHIIANTKNYDKEITFCKEKTNSFYTLKIIIYVVNMEIQYFYW